MEVQKITSNITLVIYDTQEVMAKTFLRFQEYYESTNPDFKGKPFTLGQFRDWYARSYGAFTYYQDWTGFNLTSDVFHPFYKGLFDPLTKEESALLDLFKDRTDKFCVIGVSKQDMDTANHEICHALFATLPDYAAEVLEVLKNYELKTLKEWILSSGYHPDVLLDECHAYASSDYEWLRVKKGITIEKDLHDKLNLIKDKYYKGKKYV